jgi:hypothetical protein
LRGQPDKGALKRVVLGHCLAIEVGERAQRQSIGDPFAQFAIVPVLDAHENQRTQDLLGRTMCVSSHTHTSTKKVIEKSRRNARH